MGFLRRHRYRWWQTLSRNSAGWARGVAQAPLEQLAAVPTVGARDDEPPE
jgi:hypothetical protein